MDVQCDARFPHDIEEVIDGVLGDLSWEYDEIVLDISAMTKLLILVCLCKLSSFPGQLRIVYSEAERYSPSEAEFESSIGHMESMAKFPSRGIESIVRMKCLSSIRMQGQPVVLVAFTSFNEQLVRHMLGTITPHRLIFISGRPPRSDFAWREAATQRIHEKLVSDYSLDNPLDELGRLRRAVCTLDYRDTIDVLDSVYEEYGAYERVMCAATGSKMQTVGLALAKFRHPDIHVEYPTPDSYFVSGMSRGVRSVHQVEYANYSMLVEGFSKNRLVPEVVAESMWRFGVDVDEVDIAGDFIVAANETTFRATSRQSP